MTDAADDAYARAALDGECAELAHAGASRNEQLNKAAFALGQFVGADRLTHGEVESALFDAAVANGDVAKDGPAAARARIKSGIENGSLEPRLNGAEPRRSEALPRNRHAAALPVAYGGALPPWTPPDEKGWPRFEAIGEGEPPSLQDEIPGRRHLYRRNGQPVRMKIKRRGGGFVADDPVFVPEGEKDVDTLTAHGLAAFSFGGSSDRPDGCERWVARRDIVILADNDKQGRRHARKLAAAFVAVASSVKIVEFLELPEKADVSDWLGEHGGTVEGLWRRVDATQRFTVDQTEETNQGESRARLAPPLIITPKSLGDKSPPARAWIVPEWLPCGVVTVLYGDGGLGKSLLAQQLQTSGATGKTWLGLTVERTLSLPVYCEDSNDELWRRQIDINLDYNVINDDLGDVHWMPRLGEDNLMMVFGRNGVGELTKFHQHVLTAAMDLKVKLVIIDTAADVFGGSENDRNQVRQFVSARSDRSRWGEGDGGSTGWSNSLRSRLFLRGPVLETRDERDPNARILERKKANYAARNDEIKLRWRNGVIGPEVPVSPGSTPFGSLDAKDVFLSLVDQFAGMKRALSDNSKAGNYAPRLFAKLPREQRHDYREPDFTRAMERLFTAHTIENVPYGRKSDERWKIVRSAGLLSTINQSSRE